MEGEREEEIMGWRSTGIEVSGLNFAYDGQPPLFTRFNLCVSPASRCLLVGANGSGLFSPLLHDQYLSITLQLFQFG